MDKSQQKAPKLRFKGFTDDWKQRKLGEVVSKVTKGTTPRDKSGNGTINFIKIENISNNNIINNSSFKISKEENNGYLKRSILEENDILFSIAGTLGRVGIVRKNNLPANTNQALAIIRGYKINKEFLVTVLEGNSIKRYIHANPTVGAQPNLSLKQVGDFTFNIPDIHEQFIIGKLIKSLNETITLQQQKLGQLNALKKALLQKMFADKTHLEPVLRFTGFNEVWKQRKLGELTKFINGRAYSQNELLSSGKYKVLRVGNFYTNDAWYYSDKELDNKYYANNGDLLYTWSATFGPHIWNGNKVIYHYHIWKLELTREFNKSFAFQLLIRDKNILESGTNGSTMAHITKKGMEEKIVSVPTDVKEQKDIGKFLTKLDSIITLQQDKIDKLNYLKKFLLQNMFI